MMLSLLVALLLGLERLARDNRRWVAKHNGLLTESTKLNSSAPAWFRSRKIPPR